MVMVGIQCLRWQGLDSVDAKQGLDMFVSLFVDGTKQIRCLLQILDGKLSINLLDIATGRGRAILITMLHNGFFENGRIGCYATDAIRID